MKETKSIISCEVSDALIDKYKKLAKKESRSKSYFIRKALEDYIKCLSHINVIKK